jgi:hypothetical protein
MHDDLLQFFAHDDLSPHLQEVSRPFADIALWMVETLPNNPERTAGLRKLLEAKDCAMRARLFKRESIAAGGGGREAGDGVARSSGTTHPRSRYMT